MRVLSFTIVFLTTFGLGSVDATNNLTNYRQNRFLILPGSVYVNSTEWSPLGSLIDTWKNLIDFKMSAVNSLKNWLRNLIPKNPFKCAKHDKPFNKKSIFDHLKSKLDAAMTNSDQQPTTNQSNQETTTTASSSTPQTTTTTTASPSTLSSTTVTTASPSTTEPTITTTVAPETPAT